MARANEGGESQPNRNWAPLSGIFGLSALGREAVKATRVAQLMLTALECPIGLGRIVPARKAVLP